MKDWKLAAGTVVIAGGLALPASSGAALAPAAVALSAPLAPCYQAVEPNPAPPISIPLSGGGAGDGYVVSATIPNTKAGVGDAGSADGNFDSSGNATASISGIFPPGDPIVPTKGRTITLQVTDYTPNGDVTTQLPSMLVAEAGLNVADKPSSPRAARYVTVSGLKFANQKVYGFITNRAGTKLYKRFYIGKGDVCGYARRKAVVAPTSYAAGKYKLYVNAGSKLNKKTADPLPFYISTRTF